MKYLLIIILFIVSCYSSHNLETSNSKDDHCNDECFEDRIENRMDGSEYSLYNDEQRLDDLSPDAEKDNEGKD